MIYNSELATKAPTNLPQSSQEYGSSNSSPGVGSVESQSSADSKENGTTKPPFTTRKKINQRPQLAPVPDWEKYHQLWNPIDQKKYLVPDSSEDPDDTEDFNAIPGVGAPKAASGKGVLKYETSQESSENEITYHALTTRHKIGQYPHWIPGLESKKHQNLQRPKDYKYSAPDSADDPNDSEDANFTQSNLQNDGHYGNINYGPLEMKSIHKPVKKSPGRWIYGN